MSQKNLTYKIGADIGELRREMEASGQLTRKWQRELDSLEARQQVHRQTLTDLGVGFLAYGAAVTAGLAIAGKAAMDWESAFTGVRKTVDGSPQQIAELEGELRKLARTLPASHEEIAKVAEAAGQLGIKRQDIAGFTKVMIDLGNTTNLTAEDAATGLAKLSNIMGTSSADVDRLGSALVALGNDGASTEADILAMALRIAGAGNTIGLTEAQVLGFASALSSVGIEAEAGGSSISRVMITIEQAVRSGGKEVKAFADVAGMSAADFTKKYKDDAAGAITAFIAGLGRMQAAGGNVFATLEQLGFGEILVRDALLRTAGASDMLTKSLQVGSSAWAENKALTEEAEKRYETSASKLQVAGNQIKDSLIDVGAAIAPVAVAGAQAISDIVRAFESLPQPVQDVITWVGVASAVIGVFGGAALIAVPKLLAFRESMRTLVATGGGMSGALGKFGLFLSGPWGAALGAGALALGIFGAASGAAQRKQDELAEAGKSVAQAIREQNGVINESVRTTAAKQAAEQGLLTKARDLKMDLGSVTDAILNQNGAWDKLKGSLTANVDALDRQIGSLQSSNGANLQQIRGLEDQRRKYLDLISGIDDMVGSKDKELQKQVDVAEATNKATGASKDQAAATKDVKVTAEDAAKALDDLLEAFNKLNGVTLTYREAQRDYIEAVQKAGEALAANGKTLDINTKAGRDNAAALDGQAKAANELAEAAAREAEKVGGAAAGASAMKASLDASRPALIEQAIRFGMTQEAARAYAASVLGIPEVASTAVLTPGAALALGELMRVRDAVNNVPPSKEVNVGVLSQTAIDKLRDLGYKVTTLPNGTVVVTSNTQPAQAGLDGYIARNSGRSITVTITPLTRGLGPLLNAYGNVVSFAGGGMWENHQPQIATAQPGTVRIWAEPETERESYIPWAMDRRPRALGILGMTAEAFGYDLVPRSWNVSGPGSAAAPVGGGGLDLAGLLLGGRLRIDSTDMTAHIDARIERGIERWERSHY